MVQSAAHAAEGRPMSHRLRALVILTALSAAIFAGGSPALSADLSMKQQALQRVQEPPRRYARFRASKGLLAFLDRL